MNNFGLNMTLTLNVIGNKNQLEIDSEYATVCFALN